MKWLHNLLRGLSLTGALFVFQACYGTPQRPDYEEDQEVALLDGEGVDDPNGTVALPDSTLIQTGETLLNP